MYEERERFSWTSLFIKIIIIVIFVLFTIWLLQLSMKSATRDMSNGINVLTDGIFSQNIDKMKDVGKSYFTTERLPQKIGEVKTLTLEEMYKKNLILEVKDKNGKACSAKKSYVSIEKLETEYQMKVYLECGNEHNFIKVIMGCYNYCDTDICEKKETPSNKAIEYEYSKTTGGAWGPWGPWSGWSTNSVSKTDYRDVETKTVIEPYTYQKTVTDEKYVGVANVCATISGYTLVSNKNGVCSYRETNAATANPTCPSVSGYTLTGRNGFTCNYRETNAATTNPTCPSVSGYTLTGRNGFTCNYRETNAATTNPTCPSVSGYTLTGRNGFTCSYKETNVATTNPTCPSVSGYDFTGRNGFTCNYSKTTQSKTDYELVYYGTGSGSYVPADTSTYHYVQSSADYQYKCNSTCAFQWYYTYTIYTKKYKTETTTTTRDASCPSGYSKSGNDCVAVAKTITKDATCPSGYSKSGSSCVAAAKTTTKDASCPSGYSKSGSSCVAPVKTTTGKAVCPSGYSQSGSSCVAPTKTITNAAKCATEEKNRDGKCYKTVTSTVTVEDTKKVTYYRYRLREYNGGTVDYKWSPSNNDKNLLDAGYKLTGKTREVGGK